MDKVNFQHFEPVRGEMSCYARRSVNPIRSAPWLRFTYELDFTQGDWYQTRQYFIMVTREKFLSPRRFCGPYCKQSQVSSFSTSLCLCVSRCLSLSLSSHSTLSLSLSVSSLFSRATSLLSVSVTLSLSIHLFPSLSLSLSLSLSCTSKIHVSLSKNTFTFTPLPKFDT